jgi:hypothetical protein
MKPFRMEITPTTWSTAICITRTMAIATAMAP